MKFRILLTVLVLSFFAVCNAAYLKDVPRQLIQPDGDTLNCFVTGDEFHHWLHDAKGFTIVQDPATGYYVYADKSEGRLVPTAHIAGRVNPASVGLHPGINISAEQWRKKRDDMMNDVPVKPLSRDGNVNHGTINNLVVFIRFSDDTEFTNTFSSVNSMFNDSTDNGNSMYNYFKETSYKQLFIKSTYYPAPNGDLLISYQDSMPRRYFEKQSETNPDGYWDSAGERRIREHALLQRTIDYIGSMVPADLDIDYNNDDYVDNVCFVIKGSVADWADLLWPHRWSLYSVDSYINGKRVYDYNFQLGSSSTYFSSSVLCHEMFHTLGAPDLYHYSDTLGFSPVGPWDLMGSNGNPPQQTGAYMKYKYGNWIDSIPEITRSGYYTLYPLNSPTPEKVCYKIASENPDEFYMVEYRRQSAPFDEAVPGSGIIIYRINTLFDGNASFNNVDIFDEVYIFRQNGSPSNNGSINQAHFRANVFRNKFDENTNPYPFLTDGTIGTLSLDSFSLARDSMQFRYNGLDVHVVEEFAPQSEIKVYPNPVVQFVEILITENKYDLYYADIFDMNGKLLKKEESNGPRFRISFENYTPGTYLVHIKDMYNVLKTVKVIKY